MKFYFTEKWCMEAARQESFTELEQKAQVVASREEVYVIRTSQITGSVITTADIASGAVTSGTIFDGPSPSPVRRPSPQAPAWYLDAMREGITDVLWEEAGWVHKLDTRIEYLFRP